MQSFEIFVDRTNAQMTPWLPLACTKVCWFHKYVHCTTTIQIRCKSCLSLWWNTLLDYVKLLSLPF